MVRGMVLVACVSKALCAETLREGAEKHGIFMGTSIFHGKLGDSAYEAVAKQQYNLVTAEKACKWSTVEAEQGKFDFKKCDDIRDFALKDMGGVFRGHRLVSAHSAPNWQQKLSPSKKKAALINHVKTVAAHYDGDAFAWDVVNEAIVGDDSAKDPLRKSVWYPDIPDYIDVAFRAAREATSAKLFYNDYGADSTTHKKAKRVYDFVKGMIDRGVPIDGVGLQFHISPKDDTEVLGRRQGAHAAD